jgi:hypothetical protein
MQMKNTLSIFMTGLFSLMLSTVSFAQQPEKAAEPTTATKAQQIAALEDIINRCPNPEERNKAKQMLEALKGDNPNISKEKLAELEEQKRISETLSPAEYDAWKVAKHAPKTTVPTPIAEPEEKK